MRYRVVVLSIFLSLAALPYYANAQWVQTNGVFGGNISGLGNIGAHLVVGLVDNDAYQSSNSGRSWNVAYGAEGLSTIVSNQTTLFGITSGAFGDVAMSTDSGRSWGNTVSTGWFDGVPVTLAIVGTYLFASTLNGSVYRSADNARTWEQVSTGLPKGIDGTVRAIIQKGKYAFAAATGKVFRSSDFGDHWQSTSNGLHPEMGCAGLGLCQGSLVYLGFEDSVFISTNDGDSWISTGINPGDIITSVIGNSIIFTSVSASGQGVYRSTDLGKSWELSCTGLPITQGQYVRTLLSTSFGMYAGMSSDGVFVTTDNGASWSAANSGLPFGPMLSYWPSASEGSSIYIGVYSNPFASSTYGLFCTTDNGGKWTHLPFFGGKITSITPINHQIFVTAAARLYQSLDSGKKWSLFFYDGDADGFISIGNYLLVSTQSHGIYCSIDGGANWQQRDTGLLKNVITYTQTGRNTFRVDTINIALQVSAIARFRNQILASTAAGLYSSTDTANNWTLLDSNLTNVTKFQVAGPAIYAATQKGLRRSNDGGMSWDTVSPTVIGTWINDIVLKEENMFIASDSGVFVSTDAGSTWKNGAIRLSQTSSVLSLTLANDNLFASYDQGTNTDPHGVWRRPLSEMIGQSAVHEPARSTASLHIYPNPTTSSTTITFTPSTAGHAEISVVNMLGVEVARVFSGEVDGSEHTYTFDAARMAAPRGVYEIIVRMNGKAQVVPVVVE